MAPKKKIEPLAGQRSIQAFFGAKPKEAVPAAPAPPADPAPGAPAAAPPKAELEPAPARAQAQSPQAAPAKATPAAPAPAAAAPAAATAAAPAPATAAAPDDDGPEAVVGRGVRVYWADDDAWYEGRVAAYDAAQKKHQVAYDDGDAEWLDLGAEGAGIELLATWRPAPRGGKTRGKAAAAVAALAAAKKARGAAAAKRKRAAAVIDSDDSDAGSDEGSGSEYAASEEGGGGDSDSEEGSDLASEGVSEGMEVDSDLDDDVLSEEEGAGAKKAKEGGKKGAAAAATPAAAPRKGSAAAAALASGAARTPGVALNNGVTITPTSGSAGAKGSAGGGTAAAAAPRPAAGHAPASASALRAALDRGSPGGAGGAPSPGAALADAAAASAQDASRFAARDTARFPFLRPDAIRDAARRRPGDPGHDATTLHIPPDWFKAAKVSEGQRQWWEFKAANWGSVLLFKMGKFYELFEMDAHVGAEVLGLSYMKGDQPHCGFPEAGYAAAAERLARAGHRVVVIEQTETPEGLARRNEGRRARGLKKDGVVRREKVAVLTRGTMAEPEMTAAEPDAQYVMAVAEAAPPPGAAGVEDGRDAVWVGAAAVDVAAGRLLVGQWRDDGLRSRLRAALTALGPVEVVLPTAGAGGLSEASRRVVLGVLRNPRVNELPPGPGDGQFWPADETWRRLLQDAGPSPFEDPDAPEKAPPAGYFASEAALPPALAALAADRGGGAAAAAALGGCLSFLHGALLDRRVLAAGRVEPLEEEVGVCGAGGDAAAAADDDADADAPAAERAPAFMALDGPALENLEIMENSEGGVAGTLLAALDHCATPFGRRRLRGWLCRPLCRVADIEARQDAVADLMGPGEEAAGAARRALAGVADLERALARLGAAGAGVGSLRDAPRVVLYEDVSKKRVHAFVGALKALERVREAAAAFDGASLTSPLLRQLVTPGAGRFPDLGPALAEMRGAADWGEAEATGRVVPAPGVDPGYDAAEGGVAEADAALAAHLDALRGQLGCLQARYAAVNKESHVIEVPEGAAVPREWEALAGKKGVRRYTNPELRALVADREAALEVKERAQSGILRAILGRFAGRRDAWAAAVDAAASLDALMSLAVAAACSAGPMCRPKLLPWAPDAAPVFAAAALRHPAGVGGAAGTFVPNDVALGGAAPPFVVLTGPNMGGKSTLMRQVCLAAVAAQVGAWVPAASLELTPADAVFVRMGARDRIMLGQSTFFVELSETAAALGAASRHSLVALDELGRGTATTDGAAIAAAVLDHLAAKVACRGVFATHYHHISDSHAADPAVAIKHMACAVTPAGEAGGVDQVTFLYRLTAGACPKSYGVNVARLAGLPEGVVRRAAAVSAQAEARGVAGLRDAPLGMEGEGEGEEKERLEGLRRRAAAACAAGDAAGTLAAWKEVRAALGIA